MCDGTDSNTVTPSASSCANSCCGSHAASPGITAVRPPTSNATRYCQIDTSKVVTAISATTSSSPIARSSIFASRWFSMPRCSIIAPFGSPVEPDV
ncbi:hypothetical protein Y048_6462 [Burkholderia pseudomallei MSHR456]|nr:hypothetical protein Y048_6462 [Burkholderia pseudomallei MSHR456]